MQRYTVYLYLETALHVSGGATIHHQERIQLYLQHLVFVTPLLLPAAIAADSNNGVTNTRCCRYNCTRSWWWVVVPTETCRAVSRQNRLCNVASWWINIRILLRCTDPWTLNGKRILCVNVCLHILGQQQQQLLSSELIICSQTAINCNSQHVTARPAASAARKRTHTATEESHNVLKTHETFEIKS